MAREEKITQIAAAAPGWWTAQTVQGKLKCCNPIAVWALYDCVDEDGESFQAVRGLVSTDCGLEHEEDYKDFQYYISREEDIFSLRDAGFSEDDIWTIKGKDVEVL